MKQRADEADVIVVGGGHAGVEAAGAAARRGARVLLVSHDRRTIGAMSCNPAIGGVGKGHLVREVDAMGGTIAWAADAAAIHHRMLNRSRGRAVWGPRIQADRRLFAAAIQAAIAETPGIHIVEGGVDRLHVRDGRATGVILSDGTLLPARAVVIAAGTFLGGKLFTGRTSRAGGRTGEPAATTLASQLRALAPSIRLKTGTPPRLDGTTIDWARLAIQDSDREAWTMAAGWDGPRRPQLFCSVARTCAATHRVIADSADRSPLHAGDIAGAGPRYCPSIEDKVRRFTDRDGHQIFLEPESLDGALVYPNGISTSLPADVQQRFVNSIAGLEAARVVQPGYAVEYDVLDPRQLDHGLESRRLPGLFLAGQVNGTTGYEEAAGQGLVAGLNAAAAALDLAPVRLDRRDSYLGVMIDDLTLQGVSEPYRMLTARAEHRLHLRSDNAEARLLPVALAAGCLSPARAAGARARAERRAALSAALAAGDTLDEADPLAAEVVETRRYAPYVERERTQTERAARLDDGVIPPAFDYAAVSGLSTEMRERLEAARPRTFGEARRIDGLTPAAATAVMAACRRRAA